MSNIRSHSARTFRYAACTTTDNTQRYADSSAHNGRSATPWTCWEIHWSFRSQPKGRTGMLRMTHHMLYTPHIHHKMAVQGSSFLKSRTGWQKCAVWKFSVLGKQMGSKSNVYVKKTKSHFPFFCRLTRHFDKGWTLLIQEWAIPIPNIVAPNLHFYTRFTQFPARSTHKKITWNPSRL